MSTATKTGKPTAAEQRAVLGSLSQQVAAELIGKPTIWLRDHPEIAVRNPDGTYDAQTLVKNAIAVGPVAELPDDLLEGVLQVTENTLRPDGRQDLAYAAVSSVQRLYGTAGLAAIGAEVVKHFKEWVLHDPDSCPRELPSEADHVKAAAEEARHEYRDMAAGWDARQEGRELHTCDQCGKYRLGTKWARPPLPTGYASSGRGTICPKCLNQ